MGNSRHYYHGEDLTPCLKHLDEQYAKQFNKNLAKAMRIVLENFKSYDSVTIRKYYNDWVNLGKPDLYIANDNRSTNGKLKALTLDQELEIVKEIKTMGEQNKRVTYFIISQMARKLWKPKDGFDPSLKAKRLRKPKLRLKT